MIREDDPVLVLFLVRQQREWFKHYCRTHTDTEYAAAAVARKCQQLWARRPKPVPPIHPLYPTLYRFMPMELLKALLHTTPLYVKKRPVEEGVVNEPATDMFTFDLVTLPLRDAAWPWYTDTIGEQEALDFVNEMDREGLLQYLEAPDEGQPVNVQTHLNTGESSERVLTAKHMDPNPESSSK